MAYVPFMYGIFHDTILNQGSLDTGLNSWLKSGASFLEPVCYYLCCIFMNLYSILGPIKVIYK